MYSLGIDIGYSSIKTVLISNEKKILFSSYVLHKGDIKHHLSSIFDKLKHEFGENNIVFGMATGSGSRFLTRDNRIDSLNEITATIEGVLAQGFTVGSIIDIGGQNGRFMTNFKKDDKSGTEVSINSDCSSGTGSFLEEQMSRLGLSIEDYSSYVEKSSNIPRIAGRCSVFAKTDITHHQQEGVSTEDILLGLAYAVVRNYKGSVVKNLSLNKPVFFAGGVSKNAGIIKALKDVMKFDSKDLIVIEDSIYMTALGAACTALDKDKKININLLLSEIENNDISILQNDDSPLRPLILSVVNDNIPNLHNLEKSYQFNSEEPLFLGVDIGSTSTNLVLMNQKGTIVSYKYIKTLGQPMTAIKKAMKELSFEINSEINIAGVGITGSGRYMIGKYIGADVIKDEITAQATATLFIDKDVDTIFEIGGQDSKYIKLEQGAVTDFQMNKICAAGTGSFIEEQSKKFNIPISDFGDIALKGNAPSNLGERCTVFIETNISAAIGAGVEIKNIAAGLCYSIAKNYLYRVVGQKPIGKKIFFQGGLGFNKGVLSAFRLLTGKEIVLPPFFSVTGAYGAALIAKDEVKTKSQFKGFNYQYESDFIENYKNSLNSKASDFDKQTHELIFKNYTPQLDENKKTIGIPRTLFTYGMFSMFYALFHELGFNVILSDATNEKTIELGQQYALDETCFPIKLITGHVAELVKKKVDYIFFPDLYSVDHPGSLSRKNYGCPYMQMAFKIMHQAMKLDQTKIEILSPTIAFSQGKEFMASSFFKLGKKLQKSESEIMKAMQASMKAYAQFEKDMENYSRKEQAKIKKGEKVFVLISKIYGIADPMLNMGIPDKLKELGYKVLPFYAMPENNLSKQYPNMYWPFGQHIIEPADLIKSDPDLFAILLTHHGCGPDSITSHFVKDIMDKKQYLHIEVDEHSSSVGIITRIEAFINSINAGSHVKTLENETGEVNVVCETDREEVIYIPNLFPYSQIIKELFKQKKYKIEILDKTDRNSIDLGREFTITQEYLSLIALIGDVFTSLKKKAANENIKIVIPQNEGAETDGLYGEIIKLKLKEKEYQNISVISPFIEDFIEKDENYFNSFMLALISGDLILASPKENQIKHLNEIILEITKDTFNFDYLKKKAGEIYNEIAIKEYKKSVMAVGEIYIVYNDFLNNNTFSMLEKESIRTLHQPLSELLWFFWKDYQNLNSLEVKEASVTNINQLENEINEISEILSIFSPFEKNLNLLIKNADKVAKYYSGGFGRYRIAKVLSHSLKTDGFITVSSLYENSGVTMDIIRKGLNFEGSKPVLNLRFDGNQNENNNIKTDSFICYL